MSGIVPRSGSRPLPSDATNSLRAHTSSQNVLEFVLIQVQHWSSNTFCTSAGIEESTNELFTLAMASSKLSASRGTPSSLARIPCLISSLNAFFSR